MSIRHDPFEQMEAMIDQMRRTAFGAWPDAASGARGVPGAPAIEADDATAGDLPTRSPGDVGVTVEETDDGYVVLADLPGFEREDIALRYEDASLTIAAAHEVTDDRTYRNRRVRERVHVPGEVRLDDASATYRNGVLEVTLPVEAADDGYHIDVE